MNSAAQHAVAEAAATVDAKIIPVMREAVTTVQMVLFQHLKESISQREALRIVRKQGLSQYLSSVTQE